MLTNYLVDSSVYVSALQPSDEFHKKSQQLLSLLAKNKHTIILPTLVIAETINAVGKTGSFTASDLNKFLAGLLANPAANVMTLDTSVLQSMLILITKGVKLKSSDLLILTSAYVSKSTLFSWDKQLNKESAKIITSMTPGEFLA